MNIIEQCYTEMFNMQVSNEKQMIQMLVKLIDKYGPETVAEAVQLAPQDPDPDVCSHCGEPLQ